MKIETGGVFGVKKRRGIIKSAFLICFIVFFPSLVSAQNDWKLVRDSEGIKSYVRSVDGSSIYELKAITVVNAKMEVIGEVLRDIAAYPQWQSVCKEARVLDKTGPDDFVLYVILNLPVVSDRDVIVKSTAVRDLEKARTFINFNKIDAPEIKGSKGLVRMKEFSGQYVLEYITRDKTGVVYRYSADPGKGIPSFMVNIFGKKVLHNTMIGLKEMVGKEKYIELADKSPDRSVIEGIKSDRVRVKEILRTRLLEQAADKDAVDRMMQNEELVKMFIEGDGELATMVFMASGSIESRKEAIRKLLKIYLKNYIQAQDTIEKISGDTSLIEAIITGKKQNGMSAVEMLDLYLNSKSK